MNFPWVKKSKNNPSRRTKQQVGQFAVGGYVSRRPQPTKPPKGLYKRGSSRSGSTKHGLKNLSPESVSEASPRERLSRLKSVQSKLLVGQWITAAVGLLLLLVSFYFTASVHVSLVGDSGVGVIKSEEREQYTDTIQSYFNKRPLERFQFILSQQDLSEYVSSKHAEVKQVRSVGISGVGEYAFDIEARKPVASWRMSGETFFVDDSGVGFRDNYYSDPGVSVVDNSGAISEEGDVLISSSFLGFVGRAIAFSSQRGHNVTEVTIPPLAFRQVEFTIEGLPYKVLMTTGRPAGVQVEDMDNAIKFFNTQGRVPGYIDVRVEGRAFFRE